MLHRRLKIRLVREGPRRVDRRMVMHLHVWHRERLARLLGQRLAMRQVGTRLGGHMLVRLLVHVLDLRLPNMLIGLRL